MPLSKPAVETAGEMLRAAESIRIVSHIRPDGDAVGSALGLSLALQEAGKAVQTVLADGVPSNLRFIPGSKRVVKEPQGLVDLVCLVDCSDLKRAGEAVRGEAQPDLNIDHHITNLNFARVNLVDHQATATAEMLAGLLPVWGLKMTVPVATALLSGLITDTLGFRTSNMTPSALRTAASLMEIGVDLPEIYRQALLDRSYPAARLWGAGLSRLERDGRLVWTSLSMADRKKTGYPGRDDADLINILASIQEADIALIFQEQPNRRVKVSWRAQPGIDVSQIAVRFGGGGHPAASGAELEGDLESVRETVLQATRLLLEENHRNSHRSDLVDES